jgi:peroxiredoxin Q/BCP
MLAGVTRLPFCVLAAAALAASAGCYSTPRRPDGGEGMLGPGASAPDVEAYDARDGSTRLSSLRGQPVVVYFYPKDGTPGCTKEACAFRDAWQRFELAHVAVIGVSSQSRESHRAFQKEHQLPFPLAPDEAGTVQRAYGVSKGIFGYARVSFLVDAKGTIARVWPDVDPAIHADEVLAAASSLGP